MSNAVCAACGGMSVPHAALWLSNSGDVLALGFAKHRKNPLVTTLSSIGEWAVALLAGVFLSLGRALGFYTLHDDIEKAISQRSKVIWQEARKRGIPMQQIYLFGKPLDIYRIELNGKHYVVDSLPIPPKKQKEPIHIDDKISFKKMMRDAGIPVPESHSARTLPEAKKILSKLSRVCVKPRSGSNGLHTYPFVSTEEELSYAFQSVKEICYLVSVEEHLEGNLCRATCVNGTMIGFLESAYPTLVGDGHSTIAELIEKKNQNKRENIDDIVLSSSHEEYIARRGYTAESVLSEGVPLPLTYRAGGSYGGSNRERGRAIHPSFIPIIEKAAVLTELPVVGFDLIIPDPLVSADEQRWGFIEANSYPWINLHHQPLEGEPVNVASFVWNLWN